MANLSIAVEILGSDKASPVINTFKGNVEGLGDAAVNAAKTVAAVGAVAGGALAAGLGYAAKQAMDFEKTMDGATAVMDPADVRQFGSALEDLALQLGAETAFSAKEAAAGMEELVKGGIKAADILGGAGKAALDLAAAGGIDVAEAASIAANAVGQFGDEAQAFAGGPGKFLEKASDLIAGAANASALSVTDFQFSMKAAGAVAATVGFDFDDLAASIAVMGKAGITGSDAGTSLKTMMLNLQPSTTKAAMAMEELGLLSLDTNRALQTLKTAGIDATGQSTMELQGSLYKLFLEQTKTKAGAADAAEKFDKWKQETGLLSNAFFDASGKVKPMAEVAELLKTSMGELTEQQRIATLEVLFGSDAIRAGAILAKEGAGGFNEMAAAMGQVTAAAVGKARLDNLAGDIDALKGSAETAAIALGKAFLPSLRDLTQTATAAINASVPLIKQYGPELASSITTGLGAVREWVDVGGDVVTAVTQVVKHGQSLNFWAESLPADLRPAFLIALTLFEALQIQVEFFRDVVQQALDGDVKGAFKALVTGMAETRVEIVATLLEWAKAFIEWVGPMVPGLLRELDGLSKELLGFLAQTAVATVEAIVPLAASFIDWVAPQIPGLLRELGAFADSMFTWLIQTALPATVLKLTEWGAAFVEWVAPRIPPLLLELGKLQLEIASWILNKAIPAVVVELVKLGVKFGDWVMNEAVPAFNREAPKFLNALSNEIAKWANSAGDAALEVGKDLVRGIWNGAAELKEWLLRQIKDLGAAMIQAAKSSIRAFSPSMAAAEEVGVPFMEGIAHGIDLGLPLVESKLTDAMDEIKGTGARLGDEAGEGMGEAVRDGMLRAIEEIASAIENGGLGFGNAFDRISSGITSGISSGVEEGIGDSPAGGGGGGSGGGSGSGGSTGNDGIGVPGSSYLQDPVYQLVDRNQGWHSQVPGKGPLDIEEIDYDPIMDTVRGQGTEGTNRFKSGHYRVFYRMNSLLNSGAVQTAMEALRESVKWVRSNTPSQYWGGLGWTIDGRAAGGDVFRGRSYVVGERGPEVVTMGGNGYVTPNHRLGATVYLTVNVPRWINNVDDAAQELWRALLRIQQNNGTLGFTTG